MELAGVIEGYAGHAFREASVYARAEVDRRAVRAHAHGLARFDSQAAGVVRRELDFRRRALELQFRNAVDCRAGKERSVGDEPQAIAAWLFEPCPGARPLDMATAAVRGWAGKITGPSILPRPSKIRASRPGRTFASR